MKHGSNRILDEFASILTDTMGVAQDVKKEIEAIIKTQAEQFIADMDLVNRDEFDAIKLMAAKAREENEAMSECIKTLEKRISTLENIVKISKKTDQ